MMVALVFVLLVGAMVLCIETSLALNSRERDVRELAEKIGRHYGKGTGANAGK